MQTITTRSAGLVGKAGGTPVREFLLVPFGPVQVDRPVSGGDFIFTREHAQAAVEWFARQGRKLAIDYEHQTLDQLNRRADGLAPAAGWIGGLEIRGDGLWAAGVEWTEQARTLLARGEYVYFSPVIYWADDNWSALTGLGPVALTNDPAMSGVRPLAAKKGSEHMIATVFRARPLNDDGGATGSAAGDELLEAIAAIGQAFNERDFEELVRERAVALVQTVRANFDDEDLTILGVLSNVAYSIKVGEGDDMIAGGLMKGEMQQGFKRQHGGSASILAAAWGREFAASPALQAEFTTGDSYIAYKRAEASGHVRIVGSRATGQTPPATPGASPGFKDRAYTIAAAKGEFAAWASDPGKRVLCDELAHVQVCLRDAGQARLTRDEMIRHDVGSDRDPGGVWGRAFDASPAIRAEFKSKDVFVAFKRAEAQGLVNILRRG